jgi:DNA-binding transcriptional regulator YiaG
MTALAWMELNPTTSGGSVPVFAGMLLPAQTTKAGGAFASSSTNLIFQPLTASASWYRSLSGLFGLKTKSRVATTPTLSDQGRSARETVHEVRRLSGLTWEQLARVVNVSRRAIHHWASGRAVSSAHEEHLARVLATIKLVDRGAARRNRELLLSSSESGRLLIDMLAEAQFDKVIAAAGKEPRRKAAAWPLPSPKVLSERRGPHPVELLGAIEDAAPSREPDRYFPRLTRPLK